MNSDEAIKPISRSVVAIAIIAGALAIIVRWYFVTHAQVLQPLYQGSGAGNAGEYYRYAWNMIHHSVFSADDIGTVDPKADTFRDPAYPVFLAVGMLVTDNYDRWYAIVLLTQAALGGIAVACTTLAVRDAMPPWLLATGATAMALWPHLVAIPAYVLSENLTAFFCAITALALGEAARRQSMTYTVIGGLALALGALTNSVLAPLFVPLAIILAWKRAMSRGHLIVFMTVAAVPILAWGIRNSTVPGPFSSSYRAEVNFVQGSWPTYHAATQLWVRNDAAGLPTINAIDQEIDALHTNRALGLKLMAARMSRAPLTYMAWYLEKPALLWGWEIGLGAGGIYPYPTRNSPFMTNPVMKAVEAVSFIFNGILAILALAGVIVVGMQRRPPAAILALAAIAAWVTVVYGVLQSDARYSIPYRTAEIALACVAIAACVRLAARHKAPTR
jgi:hypothetical protein